MAKKGDLFMNDAEITALLGTFAAIWIIAIALGVIEIIGIWKMYKKAGIPGWHSVIPVLNIYDWLKMAGFNTLWSLIGSVGTIFSLILIVTASIQNNDNATAMAVILMVIIGIIGMILQIMGCFKMAKRFGQGVGIGFLFLLFAPIMCMVAGFSNWTYHPTR